MSSGERPDAGNAAIIAGAVSYVVVAALSALLVALHDHFGVAATDDEEASVAEKSFAVAPALMAISSIFTVPAAWSIYARR